MPCLQSYIRLFVKKIGIKFFFDYEKRSSTVCFRILCPSSITRNSTFRADTLDELYLYSPVVLKCILKQVFAGILYN